MNNDINNNVVNNNINNVPSNNNNMNVKSKKKKGKEKAELVMLLGLILIFIGVGINFCNQMFGNGSKDIDTTVKDPNEQEEKIDIEEVNTKLTVGLANFILTNYDYTKSSGMDLLSTADNRIKLVNIIIEQEGNFERATVPGNPFPYVTEEEWKTKYQEIFGSDENYEDDMTTAYEPKKYVDEKLGEGYVGWVSQIAKLENKQASISFSTDSVDYDSSEETYTITGKYSIDNSELTSEGTFTIKYADNYIISIIFNADTAENTVEDAQ